MFKNLDEFNDKIAIITENRKCIKYIQLAENIKQISGYLYNSEQDAFSLTDKKTKSLVFIVASNTYGCLAGYLASIISGNTAMMLDENTNSDILDNLNDLYKPDLLWCPKNFETKPEDNVIINFLGYKLIKMNHNYCDGYQINSDVALLLSTSGSTGSRKMVKISYKNLESNANSIIQYLGLNENDKTIVSLPLSYSYGLSIVNTHLSVGATIIFTKEKMYSSAYWRLFDDEKVTSIYGVPYTYEMLMKLGVFNKELPSLRYMAQAGAPLSQKLQKKLAEESIRRNIRFYIMYGQTEATARISYLSPEYIDIKYGSVGKAVPGGKIMIADSEKNIISDSEEIGEIVYEGGNVTLGYANSREDLAKPDERNGRLYTGDMGYLDDEGFLYITGRKDRYIKIYGKRVSLDEIENILADKFGCECAAVCVDENKILLYTGCKDDNKAAEYLCELTGISKKAFIINSDCSIPKTASGKKAYSIIKQEYLYGKR